MLTAQLEDLLCTWSTLDQGYLDGDAGQRWSRKSEGKWYLNQPFKKIQFGVTRLDKTRKRRGKKTEGRDSFLIFRKNWNHENVQKLLLNEIVQKREKEIKSGFLVPSPR